VDFKEYSEKALRTAPTYETIYEQLNNAALGLAGEVGEVVDHIKKALFQGHEIDYEYLAKEAGDVQWYLNLLSDATGKGLEEIARMNIEKLEKRYPTHEFRVEDSVNRVV